MKPRVLFVSRERFRLPLDETQMRKWSAVGELLDFHILAAAQPGSPLRSDRMELGSPHAALDGPRYYLELPIRIARALRTIRPEAAVVQGVHEASAFLVARSVTRARTKLVLDVQGDWHEATRLYGSPARSLLNPLNDALGVLAVRRADAVRTLSPFTTATVRKLGVEPAGEFAPFMDRAAFIGPPAALPEPPRALFVGVLERYKGFDTLADAWPRVQAVLPEARLHIVGRGTLAPLAQRLADGGVSWTERLDASGVVDAMDGATLLCLPSRAEGLGRVVIEAMLRGRGVVGGNAGGIPDLVDDGVDGLLVEVGNPKRLADALIRVLGDPDFAKRLGAAARRKGEDLSVTPEQYAAKVAALIAGLP